MSLLESGQMKLNESIMRTLEQFVDPKNIKLKTNLTEDTQPAEVEILAIDRYFKENWKIELGYKQVVEDFNETAVSIMNDFHRTKQSMEVMKAVMEASRMENRAQDRDLLGRLMGQ